MNQQQLQEDTPASTVSLSSFAMPSLSRMAEPEQAQESETPLEMEQALQEVGVANSYLLPLLQAEGRQRKRDSRNIVLITLIFSTGIGVGIRHALTYGSQITLYLLLSLALLYLMLFAIIGYLSLRSYRRKRALAAELAKPQAMESIGALIEATRVENTRVRSLSKQALTNMLPQLKASDSGLLTEAQRNRMIRLLTISPNDPGYRDLSELFSRSARRREIDVRVAILKAYEQIGGPKELLQVERLAKAQFNWLSPTSVPPEIQTAAQECLPYVQSRVGEQRASEQLLRASSGNDVPADILLRAASESPQSAQEELLRASEKRMVIHLSER